MSERSPIPQKYKWLEKEGSPKLIVEALKCFGIKEITGKENNPLLIQWAHEIGIKNYNSDEIPWCGLFVAYIVKMTGRSVVINPLWARNWAKWGVESKVAMLGDILVFSRNSGGHVGLYVGEDKSAYHVLGGNQGDSVSIVRILKSRCIAIRRPEYKNQPLNVRRIFITGNGSISVNEE